MSDFKAYKTLLLTCIRDGFFSFKENLGLKNKKKEKQPETMSLTNTPDKAKVKKVLSGILFGVLAVVMLFYIIMYSALLSMQYIENGMAKEYLYSALFVVQMAVLSIGAATILNNMYFGKDNQLLMNLPVKSGVIFAVKFTLSYLSELIISVIMTLPALITFGVTSAVIGGTVYGAEFYILTVLSVFLLPILPLLLVSILAIPLMSIVSLFRNRELGRNIVFTAVSLVAILLYLAIVLGASLTTGNEENGEAVTSESALALYAAIGKAGIYNYSLVSAMVGENVAANFFIYLAGIIAIFFFAVLISALFYRKGISVMTEGSGSSDKKGKNKEITYSQSSFFKTLFVKEIKMLFSNPQFVMGFAFALVFIVFYGIMSKHMVIDEEGELTTIGGECLVLGMTMFFSALFSAVSNIYGSAGFSMERKNMCVLKSMPIRPKDILNAKVLTANVTSLIIALAASICFISVSDYHNPFIAIGMLIVLAVNGTANSFLGLYYDLKKPCFDFTNVNEVTSNKKRVKPVLINTGICFIYIVMAVVSVMLYGLVADYLVYLIYFGVTAATVGLFAFIAGKRLYDNIDELYERTEP